MVLVLEVIAFEILKTCFLLRVLEFTEILLSHVFFFLIDIWVGTTVFILVSRWSSIHLGLEYTVVGVSSLTIGVQTVWSGVVRPGIVGVGVINMVVGVLSIYIIIISIIITITITIVILRWILHTVTISISIIIIVIIYIIIVIAVLIICMTSILIIYSVTTASTAIL